MTGEEYEKLAMRTNDGVAHIKIMNKLHELMDSSVDYNFAEAINAALGMAGECGEVSDMIKKWIFHEAELDQEHLKKEVGDVLWYVALICDAFEWNLDDIMQMNIEKLKKRYPDGFDPDRSAHRAKGDI